MLITVVRAWNQSSVDLNKSRCKSKNSVATSAENNNIRKVNQIRTLHSSQIKSLICRMLKPLVKAAAADSMNRSIHIMWLRITTLSWLEFNLIVSQMLTGFHKQAFFVIECFWCLNHNWLHLKKHLCSNIVRQFPQSVQHSSWLINWLRLNI